MIHRVNKTSRIALIWHLIRPGVPSTLIGLAGWRGREHRGDLMDNGRRFDDRKMVGASYFFPIGSQVTVMNPDTGASVRVCITDRGPAPDVVLKSGKIIELSHTAFARISNPANPQQLVVVENLQQELDTFKAVATMGV